MEFHEHTKLNNSWQRELSQSITDPVELCRLLDLLPDFPKTMADDSPDFPLSVPRGFVDQMEKGNPIDPLLLQVLPCKEEAIDTEGFTVDPVGEYDCVAFNDRILKKYPGRALVLASECCGVQCRFCFRRHLPKSGYIKPFESMDFEPIRNDTTISEVILSGGDPLMLDDTELGKLLYYIEKIPHVKRIRIHSRLPVVLPSRFTPNLAETLKLGKPIYLVLHVNHPNELGEEFFFRRQLFPETVFMSQTVLLKGVNDDIDTLARLFETLVDYRIMPYYLHQLDRVRGAAHFEVPEEIGCRLMTELRNRLPGYAVPRYVREVAGEAGKTVIG